MGLIQIHGTDVCLRFVTLLVGTTGRDLVQVVQPNVYTKIPNPENGRFRAALDCSCTDIGVNYNVQRTEVCRGVVVGASTMHPGSSGSLQG